MARSDRSQGAFLTETPLGAVGLLWRETGADRRSSGFCSRPGPERLPSGSSVTSPIASCATLPRASSLAGGSIASSMASRAPSTWGFSPLSTSQAFSVKCFSPSRGSRGVGSAPTNGSRKAWELASGPRRGDGAGAESFPARSSLSPGDPGGWRPGWISGRTGDEARAARARRDSLRRLGKGDAREGLVLTIAGRFFLCDGPHSLQETSCETSPHRRTVRSALARERHRVHPAGPRVPVHGRWPARL